MEIKPDKSVFHLRVTMISHVFATNENDPTVDAHMLVLGFRENKGQTQSSENMLCFSKTAAQTQRLFFEKIVTRCLEVNIG